METKQVLSVIFLTIALIFQMIGGWMDLMKVDRVMGVSKNHIWADSLFLVMVVIAINLV